MNYFGLATCTALQVIVFLFSFTCNQAPHPPTHKQGLDIYHGSQREKHASSGI